MTQVAERLEANRAEQRRLGTIFSRLDPDDHAGHGVILRSIAAQLGELHELLEPDDLATREAILIRLGQIRTYLGCGDASPAQNTPLAQNAVTLEQVRELTIRFAHSIAERTAPLSKRLAALEKRVAALDLKPMGVSISTKDLTIDGMAGVSQAVANLTETLSRPVKPIFDERGMLAGAVRVDSAGEVTGAPQTKAIHLVAGLETRVNRLEAALAEKQRDEQAEGKA